MKRAIGIIRVSRVGNREGESFASPEIQRSRMKTECERLGIQLLNVFEELDVSGGKPLDQRPGLSRAIAAIEAHEADVVMVAYFDRLARSLATQTEVLSRVEAAGGDVMTLDHGTITNGGAAKRLEANIVGAMAQYFREQTAEKTGAAQAAAVARGVLPWPVVPAGYLRGTDGVLVPDKGTAAHVAHAFEMRAQKATITTVRSYLNDHGVSYGYHGVCKMLKNPIYLGEIRFGKLANLRAHEPLVDRELFDAVQKQVIVKGRLGKSDRLLARLGVLRCGTCGRALVVTTTGSSRNYYPAYRCPPSCDCERRVTISAKIAEDFVDSEVKARLAKQLNERATPTLEYLRAAEDAADKALSNAKRRALLLDIENDQEAADVITELTAARDQARQERASAETKQSALSMLLSRLQTPSASRIGLDIVYSALPRSTRRDLIRALVERVEVGPADRRRSPKDRLTLIWR